MKPVASIIIPSYQHADYLPDAIDSAIAQTVPCEVLVVDDGSTDDTLDMLLAEYADKPRVRIFPLMHGGVATARNHGIRHALCEYITFLDADDVIEPHKIERQIAELEAHPGAGFCLCDVRIIDDVARKTELASERYGYGLWTHYGVMTLDGRIDHLLAARNFIPVHSPLIWRDSLSGIRFRDMALEDWTFWRELALVASCCYVPEVLATYNARVSGRNRKAKC